MPFYDAKLNQFGTILGGKEYKSSAPGVFSENAGGIIYFAHGFSKRVVAFHAFIDGFSLDCDFGVSLKKSANSDTGRVDMKVSTFSYKMTLNVPAESVIESKANLAKFQELSRYINNPKGPVRNDKNRQSYIYVLLSNLIQNGLYVSGLKAANWGLVRKYGAKCYMTSIDFKADTELGFFEHGGLLVPKAYSMSLTLNLQPTFVDGDAGPNDFTQGDPLTSTKSCLKSFLNDGSYDDKRPANGSGWVADTKYWPFGITNLSLSKANIGYGNHDGSYQYASHKGAQLALKHPPEASSKFVAFDAFIDDFSFKKEIHTTPIDGVGSGEDKIILGGASKYRGYNTTLNVVAHSVNQARANLLKFQTFIRMLPKSFVPGTIVENGGAKVKAYFQNLISKPGAHAFGTPLSPNFLQTYGVLVVIKKITFTVDMDLGFFDFDSPNKKSTNFLLPKAYKMSLDMEINDDSITAGTVVPYNSNDLGRGDSSQWPFGVEYSPVSSVDRDYNGAAAIEMVTGKSGGSGVGVGKDSNPTSAPAGQAGSSGGYSQEQWGGLDSPPTATTPSTETAAPNKGESDSKAATPEAGGKTPAPVEGTPNNQKNEK